MRTHEPCDWADAVEQIGGGFLLEVVANEQFMRIMRYTLKFMSAMINAGYIGFDEKSKTIQTQDEFLEKALITIMLQAQEDLDEKNCQLVIYVIAVTLESSRHAMRWQDLNAHERTWLEAAYLNHLSLSPEKLQTQGEAILPANDRNLPTIMKFLVWGARHQGCLPGWYAKVEKEIEHLAAETKLCLGKHPAPDEN